MTVPTVLHWDAAATAYLKAYAGANVYVWNVLVSTTRHLVIAAGRDSVTSLDVEEAIRVFERETAVKP